MKASLRYLMTKTIFLDKQELLAFCLSQDSSRIGAAYEWEAEDVVHLHTAPLNHAYGLTKSVIFRKEQALDNLATYDYSVLVTSNGQQLDAKVYAYTTNGILELTANFIPAQDELYSRSKGLLEVALLAEKRATIVGLGSFGAEIALELAKAGVGQFDLFDFDRIEPHNLARHIAYTRDLGRLKPNVLEEAILGKNPYATVCKHPININQHPDRLEQAVQKADIVICATDNNQSRFRLSSILVRQRKVGLFGRAVTRAEGGDVFRYRPNGPCYCCLLGNQWFDQQHEEITNEDSARRDGRIPAYASANDANAMVQVGLSADIEPITNMMVKLALLELSRGQASGIEALDSELVYDYYIWANRRERRHANWAPMPNAGAKPTIMRWYGAHIQQNPHCSLCSNDIQLDTGDNIRQQFGDLLADPDDEQLTIEE